mgnify:CR=1 FL=1
MARWLPTVPVDPLAGARATIERFAAGWRERRHAPWGVFRDDRLVGHGGSLRALDRSGALDLMRAEGVDTISYFQVDNPLVRAIDPAFLGWHRLAGSEMSSKMVPKTDPAEKVGLFCRRDGRLGVAEYSDLPADLQREREADCFIYWRRSGLCLQLLNGCVS